MHIPDGFLANRIALALNGLSGISILYAAHRVRHALSGRLIPIMGVLSAFVFAAQMLNFPLVGGTSGHLVGGALLAIILGPMAGFLTMTTVIVAQALFLQDGGLIALGANVFNLGALTTFSGYGIFRIVAGAARSGKRMALAGLLAGWASLMLSSTACAIQLGMSGTIPMDIGLPAMAGYHAIIGLIEGGLTAAILAFLARVRPDLLDPATGPRFGLADWAGALVLIGIPSAILVLWGSSELPDPLQRLLEEAPESAATADTARNIVSALGYRGYFIAVASLGAIILTAYIVSRISRKKAQSP
jgi:cobalt/nickel transport system permease protein